MVMPWHFVAYMNSFIHWVCCADPFWNIAKTQFYFTANSRKVAEVLPLQSVFWLQAWHALLDHALPAVAAPHALFYSYFAVLRPWRLLKPLSLELPAKPNRFTHTHQRINFSVPLHLDFRLLPLENSLTQLPVGQSDLYIKLIYGIKALQYY